MVSFKNAGHKDGVKVYQQFEYLPGLFFIQQMKDYFPSTSNRNAAARRFILSFYFILSYYS